MTSPTPIHDCRCPFCAICDLYPPIHPANTPVDSPLWTPPLPDIQSNPTYVLLSTPDVLAFLDIMPLTKGHTLVVPRRHVAKMGDMTGVEIAKVGPPSHFSSGWICWMLVILLACHWTLQKRCFVVALVPAKAS